MVRKQLLALFNKWDQDQVSGFSRDFVCGNAVFLDVLRQDSDFPKWFWQTSNED